MNPKAQLVKDILEQVNKGFATEKDVAQVFKAVVAKMTEFRDALQSKVDGHTEDTNNKLDTISSSHLLLSKSVKTTRDFTESALESATETLNERIDAVAASIEKTDLTDIEDALSFIEEKVNAIKIPETPDVMKIVQPSLDHLQGEIDDIKEKVKVIGSRPSGGTVVMSRGQVKFYDLSDQLDGIKTIFALPSFWRIFSVQSTSTPQVFRPTVDYTSDASAMTLSFTAQIDAASTLAAGQTLLVLYVEP